MRLARRDAVDLNDTRTCDRTASTCAIAMDPYIIGLTHDALLYYKLPVCDTRNAVLSEKFHLIKPPTAKIA